MASFRVMFVLICLTIFSDRISCEQKLLENVAVLPRTTCFQSSAYVKDSHRHNGCKKALNGNTGVEYEPDKNCIRTIEYDPEPALSITVEKNYLIHRITIFGNKEDWTTMTGLQVLISKTVIHTFGTSSPLALVTNITSGLPKLGKEICLQFPDKRKGRRLSVCEVQIWACLSATGCKEDTCGQRCQECRKQDPNCRVCDEETGRCTCESDGSGSQNCAGSEPPHPSLHTPGPTRSRSSDPADWSTGRDISSTPRLVTQQGSDHGAGSGVVTAVVIVTLLLLLAAAILTVLCFIRRKGDWRNTWVGSVTKRLDFCHFLGCKTLSISACSQKKRVNDDVGEDACVITIEKDANTTSTGKDDAPGSNNDIAQTVSAPAITLATLEPESVLASRPSSCHSSSAGLSSSSAANDKQTDTTDTSGVPKRPCNEDKPVATGKRRMPVPPPEKPPRVNNGREETWDTVPGEGGNQERGISVIGLFHDLDLDPFQQQLLEKLTRRGELEEEFQHFARSMQHPHEASSKPENMKKNRFKVLGAYDHNRVVLTLPGTETESADNTDTDYVNASFIKGVNSDKEYIATQGPLSCTVSDFWWMVWQEGARQLVMLANLYEDGKEKCHRYWPDLGEAMEFDQVTVTSVAVEKRAHFIIRSFTIRLTEGAEERSVHQYHYTVWPDHGVAAAASLVNFWRYVTSRADDSSSPTVVHCSAGVGRTGSYIALDLAYNRKSRDLDVDLRELVAELKSQRCLMVQTVVQFIFLHEVSLEAHMSRGCRVGVEEFDKKFPDTIDVQDTHPCIDQQFKALNQLKTWTVSNTYTATMEENKGKNRDLSILPEENHMVILTVPSPDRNQYINAVYTQSFEERRGLVLTQLPLADTCVDLWRLVEGCGSNLILALGAQDMPVTVEDYCQYWPLSSEEPSTFGQYTVSLSKSTTVTQHLTKHSLSLQSETTKQEVELLHYTDWRDELPGDLSDVITLVKELQTAMKDDVTPVILQCLDGASRSGMLCVLYDVICRMTCDEEIDLFSAVRCLHQVRPQAIASQVQYRYCYRAVQYLRECKNQQEVDE